jgi:rhamnosyltransferase
MMRSDLFIDHVDTEWALRARTSGYNSYGIPNAVLMHSIGDASCKIMGKHIHLHNDIRHFYQLRNEVYLATLKSMGWQWRAYILPRIPYHFVLYCLLSKNKRGAFRILVRSVMDGLLGRLGAISDELMASSV